MWVRNESSIENNRPPTISEATRLVQRRCQNYVVAQVTTKRNNGVNSRHLVARLSTEYLPSTEIAVGPSSHRAAFHAYSHSITATFDSQQSCREFIPEDGPTKAYARRNPRRMAVRRLATDRPRTHRHNARRLPVLQV